jgi:hypothetical protein
MATGMNRFSSLHATSVTNEGRKGVSTSMDTRNNFHQVKIGHKKEVNNFV